MALEKLNLSVVGVVTNHLKSVHQVVGDNTDHKHLPWGYFTTNTKSLPGALSPNSPARGVTLSLSTYGVISLRVRIPSVPPFERSASMKARANGECLPGIPSDTYCFPPEVRNLRVLCVSFCVMNSADPFCL